MKKIREYLGNIRQAYTMAKTLDRAIGAKMLAIAIIGVALIYVGAAMGPGIPFFYWVAGIPTLLLIVAYYFGRRAEAGAYTSIEGQAGAAAAVLQTLRNGWFTTPAVTFNKNQDLIHRVVNRRGVILVSEGPASRVRDLLAAEKKRTARYVSDAPIVEVQSGREAGQVPLPALNKHLKKLPKKMTPAEVTEVRRRLEALGSGPGNLPMPKGPMPRSAKAARQVRR